MKFQIYITKKIEKLNLSANKKLERVRDLFLIGCFMIVVLKMPLLYFKNSFAQ